MPVCWRLASVAVEDLFVLPALPEGQLDVAVVALQALVSAAGSQGVVGVVLLALVSMLRFP